MSEIPASVEYYTDCSISTIHHTLQASRRRLAIGLIAHRSITPTSAKPAGNTAKSRPQGGETLVSVRHLSREIVSIEEDVSFENSTGEPYHNVYTALIQTHLPKLDDVAAVKYDSDRKTVSPDKNLLPFSMVAAITSPMAQFLFCDAVARYANGTPQRQNSSND